MTFALVQYGEHDDSEAGLHQLYAVFVDEEVIHLALEALPTEYDAFCSAIRTRNDVLTLEELNTLLNAEERFIKKKTDLRDNTAMAMIPTRGFNQNFNRGRG